MACPKQVLLAYQDFWSEKKNKKTPHKANLENERKESSDTGENSFQASKKIYESDNDVMGSLRIKHILLVPNVCKRLDMFRT